MDEFAEFQDVVSCSFQLIRGQANCGRETIVLLADSAALTPLQVRKLGCFTRALDLSWPHAEREWCLKSVLNELLRPLPFRFELQKVAEINACDGKKAGY